MKTASLIGVGILVLIVAAVLGGATYVVNETEQVVITQFGQPVGDPVMDPGLHFKIPLIQTAHYFEKRFLEWDGDSNQLPTRDKRFIHVDTYARWHITDPLKYFQRLNDERGAQTRLDDILEGETRNTIANHDLIEVVRTSNREFVLTDELGTGGGTVDATQQQLEFGRDQLAEEVLANAQARTADLGIKILDFRFKRINYVEEVRTEVYNRMISERQRIAERFRSEGAGEAARIAGEKERELQRIRSEAYRRQQEIMGAADASAAAIYANAYNSDADFYRFIKTLEVYRETLKQDTMLLLGTDSELLRFLKSSR